MRMTRVVCMDDKLFRQLLEYLGLSWQGYRNVRKAVQKRVCRHIQGLGCRNMREYLEQLQRSEEVRRQCELMMTVPISRFFRDQRLWEVLGSQILPELIEIYKDRIGVWSAGCACGSEGWHHVADAQFFLRSPRLWLPPHPHQKQLSDLLPERSN